MQLSLRCAFMTLAVFVETSQYGDFYNTFPASIHITLCTFLLLQWVKATGLSFVPPLISYIVVNGLMYLSGFVIVGIEVTVPKTDAGYILVVFATIYCWLWFSLVSGFLYYIIKTYPWSDPTKEWIRYKRPILVGFGSLCVCFTLRGLLLVYGTLVYKNTFSFGVASLSVRQIPPYLYYIYYSIGELIPSFLMIIIQSYLPSNLFAASYGELEKLIQKYKADIPDRVEEKLLCKVCMEREIDTALLHCKHSVLCYDCAKTLDDCPICRKPITQVLKIYRS